MSLRGSSLNRFRERVDAVLEDAFPAELEIKGHSIACSGPGSKVMNDYMEGGYSMNFRFPFRIQRSSLIEPLQVGDSLEWLIEGERAMPLEVVEISFRPHESRVAIVCKNRRV